MENMRITEVSLTANGPAIGYTYEPDGPRRICPDTHPAFELCRPEITVELAATIENQLRRELEAAEDAAILAALHAHPKGPNPYALRMDAWGLSF